LGGGGGGGGGGVGGNDPAPRVKGLRDPGKGVGGRGP